MEDASKAMDIAVGVIIFMIALSVNVALYVSINKAVQEVLSINDTQTNVIVSDEEINNTYVEYTSSEIFFMIQDMILLTDETGAEYIRDEYTPYTNDVTVELWKNGSNGILKRWNNLQLFINDMYRQNGDTVTSLFKTYFPDNVKYKIEYVYEYQDVDKLNLSNHKLKTIKFTKM